MQPAWINEFYTRLQAKGVTDRSQGSTMAASRYVSRLLDQRVAHYALGDSTAKRRDSLRRAAPKGDRPAREGRRLSAICSPWPASRGHGPSTRPAEKALNSSGCDQLSLDRRRDHRRGGGFLVRLARTRHRPQPETGERHFGAIRQLTFGGENAEAYFSHDGKRLIFQATRDGRTCDQQFVMNVDGINVQRVSTGSGKTTCGYFFDGDRKIFFGSTHAADTACPPSPIRRRATSGASTRTTSTPRTPDGSDSNDSPTTACTRPKARLSPDGKTIVFTSLKDGDLDIYTMNVDGTNIRRLTTTARLRGGPFGRPTARRSSIAPGIPPTRALTNYQDLLKQRLVRPNRMELWVMNADGSDQHQITNLGGANFGPFVHARRQAHHLLVELQESAQPQLRAVSRQPRRHRASNR